MAVCALQLLALARSGCPARDVSVGQPQSSYLCVLAGRFRPFQPTKDQFKTQIAAASIAGSGIGRRPRPHGDLPLLLPTCLEPYPAPARDGLVRHRLPTAKRCLPSRLPKSGVLGLTASGWLGL
jgi:hypothetical protein